MTNSCPGCVCGVIKRHLGSGVMRAVFAQEVVYLFSKQDLFRGSLKTATSPNFEYIFRPHIVHALLRPHHRQGGKCIQRIFGSFRPLFAFRINFQDLPKSNETPLDCYTANKKCVTLGLTGFFFGTRLP